MRTISLVILTALAFGFMGSAPSHGKSKDKEALILYCGPAEKQVVVKDLATTSDVRVERGEDCGTILSRLLGSHWKIDASAHTTANRIVYSLSRPVK